MTGKDWMGAWLGSGRLTRYRRVWVKGVTKPLCARVKRRRWSLEKLRVLERGMAAVTNRKPEPSVGDG